MFIICRGTREHYIEAGRGKGRYKGDVKGKKSREEKRVNVKSTEVVAERFWVMAKEPKKKICFHVLLAMLVTLVTSHAEISELKTLARKNTTRANPHRN